MSSCTLTKRDMKPSGAGLVSYAKALSTVGVDTYDTSCTNSTYGVNDVPIEPVNHQYHQ